MTFRAKLFCAVALSGFAAFAATAPANALSNHDCSVKYQAAKKDGTLNGMKWQDFRKAQCGADATPTAAPAAPAPAPAPTSAKAAPTAAPAPMPTGNAVFPNAIDQKYAKETPGKGRWHTCLDQYHANQASNGNGGLKWIQKGGGYWSECTKHLKGSA